MGHARPGMRIGDDGKPIETLLANNGPNHTPETLVTRGKGNAKRQPNGRPGGRGRPSEYSDEIGERLCEALASGQSLRKACEPKDMPSPATVYRWLRGRKDFREQYARAREMQADLLFDEILEIADNTNGDVVEVKQGDETVLRPNHANVHRARLQVDARKWVVAKLAPKKYSDTQALLAPHLDDEGKPVGPTLNIIYEKPTETAKAENGKTRHEGPDRAQ